MASGDYYTPGGQADVAKGLFLKAFGRVATDHVARLKKDVFPLYRTLKASSGGQYPNRDDILYVVSNPATIAYPAYHPFADSFRRWIESTHISARWFTESVMDVLDRWTWVGKDGQAAPQDFPGPGISTEYEKRALAPLDYWFDVDGVSIWVTLETQTRAVAGRNAWREFRQKRPDSNMLKRDFLKRLNRHLDGLEKKYRRGKTPKPQSKNFAKGALHDHFDWAVKRLVLEQTLETVVKATRPKLNGAENHTRSVARAVEQICVALGLDKPPPQKKRPRKTA